MEGSWQGVVLFGMCSVISMYILWDFCRKRRWQRWRRYLNEVIRGVLLKKGEENMFTENDSTTAVAYNRHGCGGCTTIIRIYTYEYIHSKYAYLSFCCYCYYTVDRPRRWWSILYTHACKKVSSYTMTISYKGSLCPRAPDRRLSEDTEK